MCTPVSVPARRRADPMSEAADTVAVLGAGGAMGRGMAANIAGAGIAVRAWNRTADRIADLGDAENVTLCETPEGAASSADIVLTILSDTDAVIETVEAAFPSGADDGAVWFQASTVGIEGTERCAELAAELGLELVDAPGPGHQEARRGGRAGRARIGSRRRRGAPGAGVRGGRQRVIELGDAGDGTRLKLAVNAWVLSVVEASAEMLSLAEGMGIDPALVLDAVSDGPLDLPYLQLKGRAMLDGDFTPSFRLALAAKDAGLFVDAARDAGLDLPVLEAIRERMSAAAPSTATRTWRPPTSRPSPWQ